MMTRHWMMAAAAAAVTTLLSGCGNSGPKLVSVTGIVTLNGKPLEGAVVTFHPDPSNTLGQPGEDVTGPEGNYKANTKGRSGLVPGKYHVTVTKSLIDPATVGGDFEDDPFMAGLSSSGPEVGKEANKKNASKDKVEGTFDREIPPEGGEQDFDVKSSTTVK